MQQALHRGNLSRQMRPGARGKKSWQSVHGRVGAMTHGKCLVDIRLSPPRKRACECGIVFFFSGPEAQVFKKKYIRTAAVFPQRSIVKRIRDKPHTPAKRARQGAGDRSQTHPLVGRASRPAAMPHDPDPSALSRKQADDRHKGLQAQIAHHSAPDCDIAVGADDNRYPGRRQRIIE
jgi:hypothetical protein